MGEEAPDKAMALRTEDLGLAQTPLGVLHLVGDSLRGQVFIDRRAAAGFVQPWVDSHQFKVAVNTDGGAGRLDPQLAVHQVEGC